MTQKRNHSDCSQEIYDVERRYDGCVEKLRLLSAITENKLWKVREGIVNFVWGKLKPHGSGGIWTKP